MNKNTLKNKGLKGMSAILAASAMMSLAVPAFAADTICECDDMATVAETQINRIDLDESKLTLFGETFFPLETEEGLVFPSVDSDLINHKYIDYKDESGNIIYRRYFTFSEEVNQYDIKVGGHYAFVSPLNPYDTTRIENMKVHDGVVISVYEQSGALFGTNRMCAYMEQQTGEWVTVGVGQWSFNFRRCYKVEFGGLERV